MKNCINYVLLLFVAGVSFLSCTRDTPVDVAPTQNPIQIGRLFIEDPKLYDPQFIQQLKLYDFPIKLMGRSIMLNDKTIQIPQVLPQHKPISFEHITGDTTIQLILKNSGLTTLNYDLKISTSKIEVFSKQGISVLNPQFLTQKSSIQEQKSMQVHPCELYASEETNFNFKLKITNCVNANAPCLVVMDLHSTIDSNNLIRMHLENIQLTN